MTNPLKWFDRSSLRSKFYLLGVFGLLVVALPTGLYWLEARKAIEFSQTEMNGLAPAKALFKTIQRSQQFRGLATVFLKTHETIESRAIIPANLMQKVQDVDLALSEAKIIISKTHQEPLINALAAIEQDWRQLKHQGLNSSIGWHEYFVAQVDFLRKQLNLLQTIVDSHQLSLDPDADGYFLISANLIELPELTESLGQIRALGAVYLSADIKSPEQKNSINALLELSTDKMTVLNSTIEKAFKANEAQSKNIFEQYSATQEQYQKIVQLVNSAILGPETHPLDADSYFSAFTLGINSFFSYADDANQEIHILLSERIHKKNRSVYALLFYCFLIFILAAVFVLRFIRNLIHQLGGEPSYASAIVKRITQGNLEEVIVAEHPESLLADMQKMQLKLQETDRLKAEFVSTVSHELRTPLTSISGALSISLSGQLGELPSQTKEILSIAYKNSLRLTELINDLLDIDKLITGQLVLEIKPVNLILSIQETEQTLRSFADKYSVTIECVSSVDQAYVMADERRLQQVLTNLTTNAIKFSPQNEKVYINLSVHFSRVRVEVVDQGSGIPDEFRSRIFQKFSQADASDRRNKGGTGLGLAISKALVTQMGGEINFHSSPGIGSCFFFEFKLIEDPSSDSIPAPDNPQELIQD